MLKKEIAGLEEKNSALLNECRQLYQRQKAIDQIISTYSYWKKINRSDYEFTITLPSKHLSIPLPPWDRQTRSNSRWSQGSGAAVYKGWFSARTS